MDKNKVIEEIGKNWLCMIMRGQTVEETLNTCNALIDGGAKLIEVAFTTPNVSEVISKLKNQHGDNIVISAGTVRTALQAGIAADAGAQVIVAPNFCEAVVKEAVKRGCVSMPGCITPTEIVDALECGADLIKLFPCYPFGPQYIGYINEPIPQAKMVPAGKVTLDNMKEYYDHGAYAGVVGVMTEMKLKVAVQNKNWNEITRASKHWIEMVEDMRK